MKIRTPAMIGSVLLMCLTPVRAGQGTLPDAAVRNFESGRYLGKWYEIARMPAWFENGMSEVTAEYSLRKDGKIRVLNSGIKNNKPKKAVGKARFASTADRGHLQVSFFGPFYADYVVVELDPEYRFALVISSPDYAWILSREPALAEETLQRLITRMQSFGVDTGKLHITVQSGP